MQLLQCRGVFAVVVLTFLSGCAIESAPPESNGTKESALWTEKNVKWSAGADGRTRISVCWENLSAAAPQFDRQKQLVQDVIAETWSKVIPVQFYYWKDC